MERTCYLGRSQRWSSVLPSGKLTSAAILDQSVGHVTLASRVSSDQAACLIAATGACYHLPHPQKTGSFCQSHMYPEGPFVDHHIPTNPWIPEMQFYQVDHNCYIEPTKNMLLCLEIFGWLVSTLSHVA